MKKRPLMVLRRIWMLAGVALMIWLVGSVQARGVAPATLASDALVTVTDTADSLAFVPAGAAQRAGLIFLPGALVDPVAYAPMARALAERGFTAIIVKLPYRLAKSAAQQEAVRARVAAAAAGHPAVAAWALGGHSWGGALAVTLARAGAAPGGSLVLLGTSHPKEPAGDLAGSGLQVTMIYATNDGLASEAEVLAAGAYLPPDTRWVRIEGGNHSQFGWYGFQIGDSRASISREQQQAQVIDAISAALGETRR